MAGGHISLKELSAYADGEARRPDHIARHLQQCAECARRHMELAKLSANVQALTPPQVSPALLTRVLAHARDIEPHSTRRAPRVARVLAGALAVVALAVGWFAFRPSMESAPSSSVATIFPHDFDFEAATREIEWHIAHGDEPNLAEMYVLWSDPEAAEDDDDHVVQAVLSDRVLRPMADALDSNQDIMALAESLNPSEAATLRILLSQYVSEG